MVDQKTDFFQITNNFQEHIHTPSIPILKSSLSSTPQITLAITTYKRADLLKICLDAALNQTGNLFYEVIVVDDDPVSDTDTEKLMSSYTCKNLSYYKNKFNLGLFGNWNRCIELAQGEFLSIINDDDWLSDNYMATVSKFIEERPLTDLLLVGLTVIRDGKIQFETQNTKYSLNKIFLIEFLYGNINPGSLGILFKTDLARKIGGFNNLFFPTADAVFLINYLLASKHAYRINERLANYRISINESLKTSVQVSNIKLDKLLRNQLINKIPGLRYIGKKSMPVFDYEHFIRVCIYSEEFESLYGNQKDDLKKQIKPINRIAYKIVLLMKKLLIRKSEILLANKVIK